MVPEVLKDPKDIIALKDFLPVEENFVTLQPKNR